MSMQTLCRVLTFDFQCVNFAPVLTGTIRKKTIHGLSFKVAGRNRRRITQFPFSVVLLFFLFPYEAALDKYENSGAVDGYQEFH